MIPNAHREAREAPRSGRAVVLIATSIILATYLIDIGFDQLLVERVETDSARLARESTTSLLELGRISNDLREARILLDERAFETGANGRAALEARLRDVRADLGQAMSRYEPLTRLPNEADEWAKAKLAITTFQSDLASGSQSSSGPGEAEARAAMATARADFERLDTSLQRLVAINHAGILAAMAKAERIRSVARTVLGVESVLQVVALLLLARWMLVRVGGYERRVEAHNRELDAFAGRVAHDLKNALGPLALSSSALRAAAGDSQQVLEIADRARRSTRRAMTIVESLLAFARAAEAGSYEQAANVADAARAAVDESAALAGDLGITVTLAVDAAAWVHCDPGLLHVVLANLVNNAVKYLRGLPVRRVSVSTRAVANVWVITVEDTGLGIAAEEQQRIFEPFYRVAGSPSTGLGIGLATVRRVVTALGGSVTVRSARGQGARFEVALPSATGEAPPSKHPERSSRAQLAGGAP